MKKTHILYPVSYIDDEGKQQNALYSFDPSNVVGNGYWVGEAITMVVEHPSDMTESHRAAKILEMREKLEKLEAGNANA